MNVQSNSYTFIYASVMVLIVAATLAFTATQLQPIQQANIEKEKKQNILTSVGIECSRDEAVDKYKEYITSTYVINSKGEAIDGEAFNIKLAEENRKEIEERQLPIYKCNKDGKNFYIIPVRGKGLWGPIWGYIALEGDYSTIFGIVFDHKAETPGLGAEIATGWFQAPFKGKKIFDEAGKLVSIVIAKGGADPNSLHEVDAISGGTITCKKLEKTLFESLIPYESYFKKNNK